MPEIKTNWRVKSPHSGASDLAATAGITPLQAQLLCHRGVSTASAAKAFLHPRLADLTDPLQMQDMDAAVDRVLWAFRRNRPVTVYGDYDADGITATALLVLFFTELGMNASAYIPDRFAEGYGLNRGAVNRIADTRGGVLITVDCGTSDTQEIELALSRGMEVVVTDHHQIPADFAPCCPVLNPQRPDCRFPFPALAGVGVAFYLTVAVRQALRQAGAFQNRPEPDLRPYLDLVAIGTVADMVPLIEENRTLVTAGIRTMRSTGRPGLLALQELCGIAPSRVSSEDVAFRLAPRLNAAGRMENADIGLRALTTSHLSVARDLAGQLHALNRRRQSMEQSILEQIEAELLHCGHLDGKRTLVVHGAQWHAGVLGIVASRLVARYHRPVLVLDVRDGVATGSGRSIEGFDLHKALSTFEPLFHRFGGHPRAVGLSLEAKHLDHLTEGLEELALERLEESALLPVFEADLELPPSRVTHGTVREIRSLGPFGSGNPEPLFLARGLEVVESRVVGERHLKVRVAQDGCEVDAIGFELAAGCTLQRGDRVGAIYSPQIHAWQGVERLQLKILALEVEE
jgi:single-stranded-DNA-specific exonuclease